MGVAQYSLVANDWLNLEFIINDLTQRVVGQELHPMSDPTFADLSLTGSLDLTGDLDIGGTLTLDGLTASRLVATDASKGLESIDLVAWVAATENETTVADDGDGTITVGLVAVPTLDGLILNGTTAIGLDMSGGTFATAVQKWPGGTILYDDDLTFQPTAEGKSIELKDNDGNVYLHSDKDIFYINSV